MIRRECGQVLLLILALVAGAPSSWSQTPPRLLVNGQRVVAHLRALAEFGKNPEGGISRLAYSDADRQAREYILTLMREAKLQASIDAAGNIVGRRAGSDPMLPPVLLGSHIDSVPQGGNYDGQIGSIGAIEVAQTLVENGITTRHPLEVSSFPMKKEGKPAAER